MKRIMMILLCALLLAGCLSGCREEVEAGCTKYTLGSMGLGNMQMTGDQARQESGISDLYLKLYEDGTAKMRVGKEIIQMEYGDGLIWRVDTPDAKATYVIEGDTVTITDGGYTYQFKK